jgi:hypothetical protein
MNSIPLKTLAKPYNTPLEIKKKGWKKKEKKRYDKIRKWRKILIRNICV